MAVGIGVSPLGIEVDLTSNSNPHLNLRASGSLLPSRFTSECTNIAHPHDPIAIEVQNDLHPEVSKWEQGLDPLKTYTIVKAGVTYSFSTRRR